MENGLRKRIGCVLIVSSTVATACGGGLEGPAGSGGTGGASGGTGGGSGGVIGSGGSIGLPPCGHPACAVGNPIGVVCEADDCGPGGAGGEGAGGEGGSGLAIGVVK